MLKRLFYRPNTRHPGEADTDFDWRSYVERYPDLAAAGIDTRSKAVEHWGLYGRAEGRSATATRRGSAMDCESAHSIFLRAWGNLGCWDDAGATRVLQAYDPTIDYVADVFHGRAFNGIRDALREHRMPFADDCSRCICLQTNAVEDSGDPRSPAVELFQAEPSFRCNLDCPGCVRRNVRRHAPRPLDLDPHVLQKIIGDFAGAAIEIRGFSFQGHGEPTMHPRLDALAAIVKNAYPDGYLSTATNCQAAATPALARCGIDEWVCSVDGVDQESYGPYRIGGDFSLALRFMEKLCRERERGARVRVVWRYILFEHNDSDEQLDRLAAIASDIGVDSIVLVFTENGPASRRRRCSADLPAWTASPPVEVRHHGVSVDELDRRIVAARDASTRGRSSEAAELLESVSRMISRFWSSKGLLSPGQHRILESFDREAGRTGAGAIGELFEPPQTSHRRPR